MAFAAERQIVSQTRNMTPVELDADLRDALCRYRADEARSVSSGICARCRRARIGHRWRRTAHAGRSSPPRQSVRWLERNRFDHSPPRDPLLGARKIPELVRVLPLRTSDATDCDQCSGSGWFQVKADFRIPCGTCGGMGWIDDEVRRGAELTRCVEPDRPSARGLTPDRWADEERDAANTPFDQLARDCGVSCPRGQECGRGSESASGVPEQLLVPRFPADARTKIEAWRRDYNEVGPHSSLGDLTPKGHSSILGIVA